MNNLLNDWAEGKYIINKPALSLSTNEISVEIQEGDRQSRELVISSGTDFEIQAQVFCDLPCIKLAQNSFKGSEIHIEYEVDTEGLYFGDVAEGRLHIFTNLEVKALKIRVRITQPFISIGNVSIGDMDEFAILLNENAGLSEDFFFHNDFERIVLRGNGYAKAVYRQARLSYSYREAVESFACAVGIKSRSRLGFADMAFTRFYAPAAPTRYSIDLTLENAGATDISVHCEEKFIIPGANRLKQSDFIGGKLSLQYTVDPKLLAQGINEAVIYFQNDIQRLSYRILIDNAALSELEQKRLIKKRRLVLSLMSRYIDFRLGKASKEEWAKRSLSEVQSLIKLSENMFYKLYEVHLLLALNESDHAKGLLYSLNFDHEKDITVKAYFLYLVAFFKDDESFAAELTEDLKKYRKDRPELFSLLWFLLFLDDEYVNNPAKRYRALKQQYLSTGGNAILLCETAILLNKNPELLSEFTDFEIQACSFALKHDYITGTLWNAIFHIAGLDRSFRAGIYRLLRKGYEKYLTDDRLGKLCSYCITGGCYGYEFLGLYEQAIMKGSSISEIYEYYLRSIPAGYSQPILKQALHYFKYKADVPYEDRALIYTNIIKFYQKDDIYSDYAGLIRSFTIEILSKQHIYENAVFLYNNVLKVEDINALNVDDMAFVSLLALIRVDYPDAVGITVCDSRLNSLINVKLIDGMTIIPLCFDDICISFEDREGRSYIDKSLISISRLISRPDLLQACRNYAVGCFEYQLFTDDYRALVFSDRLADEFAISCNNRAAVYYSDNPFDEAAFKFMEAADVGLMSLAAKYKMINLNIIYNRTAQAIKLMSDFGYYGADVELLANMCEELIGTDDKEQLKLMVDDRLIVNLSAFLYNKGIRSIPLMKLLALGWQSDPGSLIRLWDSCRSAELSTKELEERILQLCCYLRSFNPDALEIYESYTTGQINKKIALGYLSLSAFELYALKEKPKNRDRIFFHIVNYYMNFKSLSGVCMLGALDYLSEKRELNSDEKEFVCSVIKHHISGGIFLDIFESFNDLLSEAKIELSYFKRQRHFVVHIDEAGELILIKYRLLNKDGLNIDPMIEMERGSMQEIYPCIYIKDFILFAEESIEYTVMGFQNEREIELYDKRITASKRRIKQHNKDRYDMVEEMMTGRDAEAVAAKQSKISVLDAVNQEMFLLR